MRGEECSAEVKQRDRNECKLRDFYEEKFIPPVEHWVDGEGDACNCEYAY